MKLLSKILLVIVAVTMVAIAYWRYDFPDREHRVTPEALAALESDTRVTVTENDWIIFSPSDASPTKGLIFYPGGECDERGYAEPLRAIAASGFLVVLVPMPWQLAVFAPNRANDVIAAFPEIKKWAIGGHSLGGSMAANYAANHQDLIEGLLLWDAYSPNDLANSALKVRMVHRADASGEPPEDYTSKLPLLPAQTEYVPLIGGQHLNFGRFIAGRLYRDAEPAELDPDKQRAQAAAASADFMQAL
jgi:pimeloyl-ACP methyl ester carboxylesterase